MPVSSRSCALIDISSCTVRFCFLAAQGFVSKPALPVPTTFLANPAEFRFVPGILQHVGRLCILWVA